MQMIPKKIHYCWFGGKPLPNIALKCMESWEKHCPEYEIVRWDESNCDIRVNKFVQQAYREEKWAFVSDYFRLKIIEENGGVYLDTDVELIQPLDDLLSLNGFMGFELSDTISISTGLGFGAVPRHPVITKLRENYEKLTFIKPDGSLDTTTSPIRDTKVLVDLGLVKRDKNQRLLDMSFFSSDYFCPISDVGQSNFSENTYSIHHYNASWYSEDERRIKKRRIKLINLLGYRIGNRASSLITALNIIKKEISVILHAN